ncbi:3'(2'),5'-bisphosphate nucleotidase CysQ, partial [Sphingomonas koreensis]
MAQSVEVPLLVLAWLVAAMMRIATGSATVAMATAAGIVAPVAVALAAGLHASRIDGSPLVYNQPGSSMPDLLICRRELADTVLDQVAKCDF